MAAAVTLVPSTRRSWGTGWKRFALLVLCWLLVSCNFYCHCTCQRVLWYAMQCKDLGHKCTQCSQHLCQRGNVVDVLVAGLCSRNVELTGEGAGHITHTLQAHVCVDGDKVVLFDSCIAFSPQILEESELYQILCGCSKSFCGNFPIWL